MGAVMTRVPSKKQSQNWNKSSLEQKSEQVLLNQIKHLRSSVPAFQLNSKMCRVKQKKQSRSPCLPRAKPLQYKI